MTEGEQLAWELAWIATDLERRLYPRTGTLRRAARLLIDNPPPPPTTDDGCRVCPGCGTPIPYTGRGRPRVWCPDCTPPRKSRKKVP